jgi:hypothetical protein
MTESLAWRPFRFRPDGLLESPEVHDNFVDAVAVHLEPRALTLHTQYRDGVGPYDLTDLWFVGGGWPITWTTSPPGASSWASSASMRRGRWAILFGTRKNYGWPVGFADLADLSRRLGEPGVVGYRVRRSLPPQPHRRTWGEPTW